MKSNKLKIFSALLIGGCLAIASCKKDSGGTTTPPATAYYQQEDQVGRPAINTVFNDSAHKQPFNTTAPSAMSGTYQPIFMAKLTALNPIFDTASNALGQSAAALSGLLATDVLNVATTGPTIFFNSSPLTVLTGRGLSDDVIDDELLLIFGGPAGTSNPGLTSDHVNANDKPFLTSFPYEAAPW